MLHTSVAVTVKIVKLVCLSQTYCKKHVSNAWDIL